MDEGRVDLLHGCDDLADGLADERDVDWEEEPDSNGDGRVEDEHQDRGDKVA